MTRKHTALFAAAALVSGFLATQGALAQQAQPAPAQPGQGQGMTGMQPGQGSGMRGMMGMMNMMGQMDPAQMNRMMENCNKMMEGMNRGQGGSDPATPAPNQQRG
ncbi:hypothetical protein [Falsiroseomonas tokyonensis]|uniref:DUF4175 domain-containing protein n=1 Tax=Falsiroseomonas tokyonensis TaxID=430521 RepID=A0ABV7C282_9PROT|nr:hypothetical protein [Falsiroseomonas tokyonensis]MBU8541917.1 hypothetical protein [Falsiroseomonas tokyonensis]